MRLTRRALTAGLPLAAWASGSGAQATTIAAVERVVVWGYGTPPGRPTRDLFERDRLVEDEAVETPRDGALHLKFGDGTAFRLGSQSKAVLDRFVFDPQRGRGQLALELGRGSFRFISGRMDKGDYALKTPSATMGIRGTDFVVEVGVDLATVVSVLSGVVTLNGIVVAAGQQGIARMNTQAFVQQRPRFARTVPDGLDDAPASGGNGTGSSGGTAGGGQGR